MFIFMEYCADGTISDVAKLGLPESMIRVYTYQILVAVSVLHEKGIVHRDVKGEYLDWFILFSETFAIGQKIHLFMAFKLCLKTVVLFIGLFICKQCIRL